jgi:DNA helicase-2/ATP-dependent DNA helicase PcrA
LLKLFESSAKTILVGDPRQVTYLTHQERKYAKYSDGGIVEFLQTKAPRRIKWRLDTETLGTSHRNSGVICELSSLLYPGLPGSRACECADCRPVGDDSSRLYLVRSHEVGAFLEKHNAMQLRDRVDVTGVHPDFPAMNFGMSKGLGFARVLIFPTLPMLKWLKNADQALPPQSRAKLYVAVTRARHGLAVVTNEQPASFHYTFHQFEP